MPAVTAEKIIPEYPFEPDAQTGNSMFLIRKNDSIVNYRKADFLVPHRKGYYFFAFVRQGSSRHWIDMKPYTLQPDTFYFTVPRQVHLKEESKPLSGITLSFTEEFLLADEAGFLKMLPVIRNPHEGHELRLSPADVQFLEDTLERIYEEYHTPGAWQQQMLMSYTRTLLIYLSRLYHEQMEGAAVTAERRLLKRYLAEIETQYTQLHDVAGYASLLNITPGHLNDMIKTQSGKTAIMHIHDRLILESRRLLFHTSLSVKEIAHRLGFEDASYFNRFFKRLAGQTPVLYRKDIREKYH